MRGISPARLSESCLSEIHINLYSNNRCPTALALCHHATTAAACSQHLPTGAIRVSANTCVMMNIGNIRGAGLTAAKTRRSATFANFQIGGRPLD